MSPDRDRMAAGYFETVDADLAASEAAQPASNVNERQPRVARRARRATPSWRCAQHDIVTTGDCPECDRELIALTEKCAKPR